MTNNEIYYMSYKEADLVVLPNNAHAHRPSRGYL